MSQEIKLLRASLQGDTAAFEQIILRYQAMVCAITYSATGRMDASEELAQETFLRAWQKLVQLQDLNKFRSWLCSIARNLIRDYLLHKSRQPIQSADLTQLPADKATPFDHLIKQEEEMILSHALMQIPEEFREPLVLYYRQEQSVKEVAESLDIPEATVRTRMHRGRQMLKDQVADMVEQTLAKSGPGKRFTKAVMVSIGAGLAATTAATAGVAAAGANTGSATGGASSVLAGIGIKTVTIAAAVFLIGTGVLVHSYWNSFNHTSTSAQVVRTEPIAVQSVVEKADSTSTANVQVPSKPAEPPQVNPPVNLSQNNSGKDPASLSQDTGEAKSGTGISGIVLDKSTSKPIKDAEIWYGRESSSSVLSDTNGRFELLGMKPMPRQLIFVIAKSYISRTIVLEIIKDKMYHDFKVELVSGSRVSGIVSDPNGNPIEDASVKTFSFTNRPVKTNKNGEFEIDGMDPAFGRYSLHTAHPNYPAMSTEFSPAAAGQTAIVDVILTPGITVHGRITNTQGLPLPNVSVGNTTSPLMWNCIKTKTDKDGMYTLKNIIEGDFVIWAVAKQYAPYVEQTVLDSSQSTKLINIQLADPCPIHGKIIDAMGNPVPGVNISLSEYKGVINLGKDRTTSDANGRFTIPNGPREGQMILEVFGKSIPNTQPQFEAGLEQEYIIKVDRAGRIYGKVVDNQTGAPIGKFNVKLTTTTKGTKTFGYSATWERQGHTFESSQGFFDTGIEMIPLGGQYAVTVTADNLDPLTIDPVTVQPTSEDPNRTEFRLKAATALTGRIVDCNSVAIEGAFIRRLTEKNKLSDEHWDSSDTATTDSNGKFVLSGIGTGSGAVYITAPTFAPYLGPLSNLPRNSQGAVEIVLAPGASIFGKVIDPNNRGLVGARVSAHIYMDQLRQLFSSSYPDLKTTTTDMDGYYEISGLPAGTFSVGINTPLAQGNKNYAQKNITLKAGQSLEINFGNESGFTVTGIVRKGRQLLEKAQVTLAFSDQSYKHGYTDKKGQFTIKGIPKDRYEMFIDYEQKDDTATSQNTFQRIHEMRQINVKDNTYVDFDFGDGVVKGKIPAQYLTCENLQLLAAHCRNKGTDSGPFSGHRKMLPGKIDSEGNYECSGLCSGWYYLQLYTPEQTLAVSEAFEMGESQHIENIPLKSGTGVLGIHCVDSETGQNIANAAFGIENECGVMFRSKKLTNDNDWFMKTDDHGMAEFPELPPGKYFVRAQASGYLVCQSELLTVNNSNITPVTVYLTAVCAVRFELSEQMKSKITKNNAYLIFRVTDLVTQKLIPMDGIYALYFGENHLVWLKKESNTKDNVNALLTLPPGRYEIQYSLYQDNEKAISYRIQTPLLTGMVEVELAKRDTETLTITQNQ
jgi:RNA polymerase sigma factor (sigma-70 family)